MQFMKFKNNNNKDYLWNRDGIKVERANFDLLEEEVELGASWSRLTTEGQRVTVWELPLDAGLQADLIHPSACEHKRKRRWRFNM